MRVGLVLDEFDPHRGGSAWWAWQFALALVSRSHVVHVVARRFADQARHTPIVTHRIADVGSRVGFGRAAEEKLRSLSLDVIHDTGAGWYCDVFQPHGGSWLSITERKLQTRASWIRPLKRRVDRMLPRHRDFRRLLQRQYVDNGQLVVALSRTVAEDLQHFHNVPPERIRIVYNGVDTDRFSPHWRYRHRLVCRQSLGVDDATVVLLIVAHNFALKGVPTLLRAVRELISDGQRVHLVVVGGKRLERWRRRAARLGIGAAVTLAGTVPDARPYYAAADVYVHPTFYDPCSLVLLEAAASGLPIITTKRCNGVAELLQDGAEAFLIEDAPDYSALAARVCMLLNEPVRRSMGIAARHVALRHTFERNVNEMLAVYAETTCCRRAA